MSRDPGPWACVCPCCATASKLPAGCAQSPASRLPFPPPLADLNGFTHGDPHPGNLLVRPRPDVPPRLLRLLGAAPALRPQLVLLDHGVYVTLPDHLRRMYCQAGATGGRGTRLRMAGLLRRSRGASGLSPAPHLRLDCAAPLCRAAAVGRDCAWRQADGPPGERVQAATDGVGHCGKQGAGGMSTHRQICANHAPPWLGLAWHGCRQPRSWRASRRAASCLSS